MAKHVEDGPLAVAMADAGELPARVDRAWLRRVDAALGLAVDLPAAGLLVAEIAVLLAGVISHSVFEHPLVWSEELASTLFIWLAMLGSVGAFRRGEHMQMTVFVSGMPTLAQAVFDAFTRVASAVGGRTRAWATSSCSPSRFSSCLAALALALVVAVWLRNRDVDQSGTRRARWAERDVAFVVALPALTLPFVIRAAVIEGIAPASEVPDKLRSAKFYSDRKGDFGDEL